VGQSKEMCDSMRVRRGFERSHSTVMWCLKERWEVIRARSWKWGEWREPGESRLESGMWDSRG